MSESTGAAGFPAPREEAAVPHQTPHQILVIDDESGIRRGCQRVLTAEGHEVLAAETAEQGLELLQANPGLELAFVDLRMPGLGGLEFLSQAAEQAPELVMVVITAYATLDTAIEATRRGAYDFLPKPFTPDDLVRLTAKGLERARLIQERNRLQAERESQLLELATEQSRLRSIVNCMADAVLVCNTEGQLVLHNPAALRVLPHLGRGQQVHLLEEEMESPELLETIQQAAAGRHRLSREIQLPEALGGQWVLADVSPVIDELTGSFRGTVTVLSDITELRRVEQVKAQFVNMVAHELRAPLAAVDGYLSVMMEGLVPKPEKQHAMLGRSRQRLQALLALVNDLLDVARMEAGTVRREIALQQLAEIVGEVIELMTPLAAESGVTLRNEVSGPLPGVEVDREEIIRLFNNLVSNAVKYNKPGGEVIVSAAAEHPYVRLSVTDTGVGISEEGQRNLFREFFREKRRETTYVTGTGLGLSIVKGIVDFYHGRIEAKSQLGEGSTFTVWLPCKHVADRPICSDGTPATAAEAVEPIPAPGTEAIR